MKTYAGWQERLEQCGELGASILRHDWQAAALGAPETWHPIIAAATEATLCSVLPAALLCGPDRILLFNAGLAQLIGPSFPELLCRDAAARLLQDEAALPLIAQAYAGEAVLRRQLHIASVDGVPGVGVDVQATPLRDAQGNILCVQCLFLTAQREDADDVRDLHALRKQHALLLAELRHRVRNALGNVRAIARRTAEASSSVEDYAMHFEGRLDALARIETLLSVQPMAGATLESLVAGEVMAAGGREDGLVDIAGPSLRFKPDAAEIFGLAMHELATNAVKFGALSPRKGGLSVNWQISATAPRELRFCWKETISRTMAGAPARRGFGLDLLERALPYELNCQTTWRMEADGVRCSLEIPTADRVLS